MKSQVALLILFDILIQTDEQFTICSPFITRAKMGCEQILISCTSSVLRNDQTGLIDGYRSAIQNAVWTDTTNMTNDHRCTCDALNAFNPSGQYTQL